MKQQIKSKTKKTEPKEMDSSSSGSYEAPIEGTPMIKRPIGTIPNFETKEQELDEVTDSSSSGAYDVPLFGGTRGRKNPLSIGGPKTVWNSKAAKDPHFPMWVKGGSYVDVKKKCRLAGLGNTSAQCNQGDITNLNIWKPKKANEQYKILKSLIDEISKETGLPKSIITELVSKEIKDIFI